MAASGPSTSASVSPGERWAPSAASGRQTSDGSTALNTASAMGRPASTPPALATMTARPFCSGGTRAAVVTSCQASSSMRAFSARRRRWAGWSWRASGSGMAAEDDVPSPFLSRLREVGAIVGAAALGAQEGGLAHQAGAGEEVGQLVGGAVGGRRKRRLPGGQPGLDLGEAGAVAHDTYLLPHQRLQGAKVQRRRLPARGGA